MTCNVHGDDNIFVWSVCYLSVRPSLSWDLTFILIYSIKSDVISDLPLAVIGFYITRSIFKTNLANFNSILLSRALYFLSFLRTLDEVEDELRQMSFELIHSLVYIQ